MKTATIAAGVVLLASGLTFDAQEQMFRGSVDLVSIDVSVTRRNAPVGGLKSEDFELLDNGVAQAATCQTTVSMPVDVSLVFDEGFGTAIDFAGKFSSFPHEIAEMLRSKDRLQMISAGMTVRETVPMQSPDEIRSRDFSDIDQSSRLDNRHALDFVHDPEAGSSVFDALLFALAWPQDSHRRHIVVLFSRGADKGSVLDVAAAEPIAQRADAVLHAVLWNQQLRVGQPATMALPSKLSYDALVGAARATGGDVHYSTNGVGAFKSIFDDFRQSYVLTYTLKGAAPAGWHALAVHILRHPEYTVHARPGYAGR